MIKILNNYKVIEKFYNLMIKSGLSKTSKLALFINYKLKSYPKNVIYFMHISKCGGTTLRDAFIELNKFSNTKVRRFPHAVKANNLNFKNKNKYIISIREPLSRYFSAYYDRKRSKELNKIERSYYELFPTANKLAEALSHKDNEIKFKAIEAMEKIELVNHKLEYWFSIDFLKKQKPYFIFEQEKLEEDFIEFCRLIKFNKKINFYVRNKNLDKPESNNLSHLAISNLKKYLKNDFQIYNYLTNNKKNINPNN